MSQTITAPAPVAAGNRTLRWTRRNAAVVLIYGITAALVIVASIMSPTFRDVANITDVLRQSIVLGLVTIGQLFVILAGGTDMSVGMAARVVGLGVAVALTSTMLPPILVIVLGLLAGALIGLLNGLLVARFGAQPFIVTLGTMGVLYGLALAISDGPTGMVPRSVVAIYEMKIGPLPASVIVMAMLWLATWWVLRSSRFGRATYAVGGSPSVSRLAGLNVNRVLILTYTISGVCAAAAGIFLLARSGVGNPNMALGLEFQSIVAAAIGGVSLYGGRGSLVGALGAVLLISVISNLFDLFQISAYFQDLTLGVIVVLAVAIYRADKNK
ncbi:ABC transporter permease [Streptosporangium amethystogenes]|uniref:ABC transporter permease n=1 Tax=Streptosporangium amethystogenes TaxID=2002 RepID=UPI000A048D07|nr:ABC transporter permease [Streptosporangium amethystogenes]